MSKKEIISNDSLDSLKQVRDIICGEAIADLQKQIEELREENVILKKRVDTHDESNSKASSQINELFTKHDENKNSVKSTNDYIQELKTELEQKIKDLKSAKIDKNQIGQVFIDWGMKVKQNSEE